MKTPVHAPTPRDHSTNIWPWTYAILAVVLLVSLSACQVAAPVASDAGTEQDQAIAGQGTSPPADAPRFEPLAAEDAAAPVRLQIPDIGLDVPVTVMEWRVVTVEGERSTAWDVPLDSVGWHANSAGAGAAGNTLLSGHQAEGAAVLEPLALGSIVQGQDVLLTDENERVFLYQVREVSEPIPITGATEEEQTMAQSYLTASDGAQLTLITGWPEFTTTHRVFAVADLQGTAE